MKKKYSILFFLAIAVLVVSEYFLLAELSEIHSIRMLILSSAGLLLSAAVVIVCYIRSARDAT